MRDNPLLHSGRTPARKSKAFPLGTSEATARRNPGRLLLCATLRRGARESRCRTWRASSFTTRTVEWRKSAATTLVCRGRLSQPPDAEQCAMTKARATARAFRRFWASATEFRRSPPRHMGEPPTKVRRNVRNSDLAPTGTHAVGSFLRAPAIRDSTTPQPTNCRRATARRQPRNPSFPASPDGAHEAMRHRALNCSSEPRSQAAAASLPPRGRVSADQACICATRPHRLYPLAVLPRLLRSALCAALAGVEARTRAIEHRS